MDITLAIIEGRWTECGRDPQDGHALTRGVPARNVERAREVWGGIKAALKRQRFAWNVYTYNALKIMDGRTGDNPLIGNGKQ